MINIAFLGNSHVACVKRAWDEVSKDYESFRITFFASHADTLVNTELKDGRVVPLTEQVKKSWSTTSGGSSSFDPLEYDVILLHGLCPSLKSGSWTQLNKFFESDIYLSVGFRRSSFKYVNRSMGHLLSLFHSSGARRVVVTPRPLSAEYKESMEMSDSAYESKFQFVKEGFQDLGVEFVSQPLVTISQGYFTKDFYNSNALGLGAEPDGTDHFAPKHNKTHMNVEYGKEYLRDFLSVLA